MMRCLILKKYSCSKARVSESTDPKQYIKRMKLRDPELAKGWVQIVPLLSIQTEGAEVAKTARKEVEKRIGRSVVSPEKAIDHIQSPEEPPFQKPEEQ